VVVKEIITQQSKKNDIIYPMSTNSNGNGHGKGKSTGRPCSCCTHADTKAINKAIYERVSFRHISTQYGMSESSVKRHANKCLFIEARLLNGHADLTQQIDVVHEFQEQLQFAKDLREAARKWLLVAGDIDLDPRSTEVQVVYLDPLSVDDNGNMEQKKAPLEDVLNLVRGVAIPRTSVIKTVDLRKFALDAINTADTCIDKFAKLGGLYTNPKDNPDTIAHAISAYHDWAMDNPNATYEEQRVWLSKFASQAKVTPDQLAEKVQAIPGVQ